MNPIKQLEGIDILVRALRIFVTYYLSNKIVNNTTNSRTKTIIIYIVLIIISIIYAFIRNSTSFLNSTILLIFLLAIVFAKDNKEDIAYSVCIVAISSSISYILYFLTLCLSYIPVFILRANNINNDYTSFIIVIVIYIITSYAFLKIKKFKNGFAFLQKKLKDGYLDILVLNISVIILFLNALMLSLEYEINIASNFVFSFIIIVIIMFITIQKSLKLYYKQKMLIKDLNETKDELENKKKEIEELEKENLNFSKISHSIAHKQKSLEHKLDMLITKNQITDETNIKERLSSITKDLEQETTIELSKTDIQEIDDMLSYMQSECTKNKIDFQLQLNGNIHTMVNNYIDKDKLEILLADLIKNSVIAIKHSENENKSILVRLGMIDGNYSLYVYDSGIEFELETLSNLGIKPSTTHKDSGGSGIGMMNTFDTLRQYKASMVIEEYGKPCKDNFTKVIQIVFDKKNEFKIKSYRDVKVK